MRIAIVSTEVRGFHTGGIGSYVVEAGAALTAAGHEVWLITHAPDEAGLRSKMEALPGFAKVAFVDDVAGASDGPRFGLARVTLRFAQLAHDCLLAAGVPFDYIEFADYGAAGCVAVAEQRLFGSHGDAVVAVALHSPTFDCWQHNEGTHVYGPLQREVAVLEHEAIALAPVVWSPSLNLAQTVSERLGRPLDQIEIVRYPMLIDAAISPRAVEPSELTDLSMLYCGRVEPRKGVRELVEAFKQMPELAIVCVGADGNTAPMQTSEVDYLRRLASSNVTFAPPLGHDALLARLRETDVVVLPSRWDNWPNMCLEAMAAGCIVIGGHNSGMAEMISHGETGFLVDSTRPDDLQRVIREDLRAALPRLPQIRDAAARRSRELCDPPKYAAAIEELVAGHRGKGRWPITDSRAVPSASPRVSIIVPFYNEGLELVGAAVDSAIAQSYGNLEILLVNDGSPRDDATAILAAMAARDPRVRVLSKSNGGLATARNHAIEQAAGQFVLCLDSDNILCPDYVETGLQVFARAKDAVAVMPRFEPFLDGTNKPLAVVQALPFDRPLALFRNSLGDGGAMFRRDVFTTHGLRYDSVVDCYSDWALWLDLARLGLRVQVVPRTLYRYRIRSKSMMAEQAWDTHLAMLGLLIERHLPDGNQQEMLVNLTQGWGVGALLAALGQQHHYWEDPTKTAQMVQTMPSAAALFASGFDQIGRRRPKMAAVGRAAILAAARVHGWFKRRREAPGD